MPTKQNRIESRYVQKHNPTHAASHLRCYIQIQRNDLVYQEHESIKKNPDSDLNYKTFMNFMIFEIDKQKKEDLNLKSSRSYECGEPMPRELASIGSWN